MSWSCPWLNSCEEAGCACLGHFESPISMFFLEKCLGVASCCSVILLVSKSVGWCGRKGAVVGDPDTVLVSDVCERQTWSDRVPRDVVKLLKAYSFVRFFFFFPSGF